MHSFNWFRTNYVDHAGLQVIEISLPLPPSFGTKGICHHAQHPSISQADLEFTSFARAPRVLDLQVRPYSLLENRVTGASNAPKQEFLMENGLAFQQFLTLLASLIIALLPTDFFLLGFGREFSPPSLLSRGRHQFWSSLCLDRLTIKLPHLLTTAHHSLQ